MSTYLVALLVGEFDYIEDKTPSGVRIRVFTPKGKSKQGKFALEVATRILPFYEKYFRIPYPLPKLDCVAVADFAGAAMENWGLLIFRESCMLFDEENTSIVNKQWISLVVAHELAHQWFGNLVTMKWWTDLWLNEGYATFTEFICINELYPEFDTWKQFLIDILSKALELDALKNSHPIEVPINDPMECEEIFDDISYNKAASVIRMLYSWIGDKNFLKGMSSYLNKYTYSNAETKDLWNSLEGASSKPVKQVMSTWTLQTGYPLLKVEEKQQGNDRVLSFAQERFLSDRSRDTNNTLWNIPVNIATSAKPEEIALTTLITEKETEVTIPNVPPGVWVKVNPGIFGFYRTQYSQDMMYALLTSIENKSISAMDRYGVLDDLFNCAKAGYTPITDFLKVIQSYKQEDDYIVWTCIASCLSKIRSLISHLPIHEAFKSYCRNIYRDISLKIGWDAKPEESHLDTLLRTLILNRMVMLQEEEFIAEAKRRFELHITGTTLIPADIRCCVYNAVVNNGDESTINKMIELYDKTELDEERHRILRSLGVVRDKNLLKRVLEFGLSDNVKPQSVIFIHFLTSWSAESRDYIWEFVKDNWNIYNEKINIINLLVMLIKLTTTDFVSEDRATDIEEFFKANPNSRLDKTAKQSIEKIRLNAEWLNQDKDAIEQFLKSQ